MTEQELASADNTLVSQSHPAADRQRMNGALNALREAQIRLVTDIADTLAEFGPVALEDRRRLIEIADDLRDMFFLVVIIGEFNAGKSSFVNALIGDELLPVGVTPTTETIEIIKYADAPRRQPVLRGTDIREWAHPQTGAPGVALVDTPGTGSVFLRHEVAAKAFLHRSDLVIFVISAKRALAQTERLYLELSQQYGKKVILVINQADLLTAQERVEVRRFVERQVEELLNIKPLLFMVSARESLQSRTTGVETGGVDAVRAHLRGLFTDESPARQKLVAQIETVDRIISRYIGQVQASASLIGSDRTRVRDVERELSVQSDGLNAQLRAVQAEVSQTLEGIRVRGLEFLSQNLSLRRIGRLPEREKLQKDFYDKVIGRSLQDMQDSTEQYVNALVDHSRLYWRGVIDRLNQLQAALESEVSGLDASAYAEQREALQEAIRTAEAELRTYSSGRVLSAMETDFRANFSGFALSAAASVAGLFATLAAFAAPGPIVGTAAAASAPLALPALIIGAPAAAVGGFFAFRYYRRMTAGARRQFNEHVDQLQHTFDETLKELTQRERTRLTQYGHQVLTPIMSRLDVLSARYAGQEQALRRYQSELASLRSGIDDPGSR